MSVQNPERVVTKQDLADFYGQILPYLGGMPEILANKFSKGDMYSTDEKMIGQWIDGKPLYQKTFNVTTPSSAGVAQNIAVLPSDIDKAFIVGGAIFPTDVSSPIETYSSSSNYVNIWIRYKGLPSSGGNNVIAMILESSDKLNSSAVIVVRYTKTTDSAVSIGNDTDYSTDEKIIGTWIDGRPIWQKSVQLNSSVSLTQDTFVTLFNLSDYSMDKLIGITLYNSSSFNNPLYNFITWLRDGHCDVRSCGITWNVGAFTIQYVKAT